MGTCIFFLQLFGMASKLPVALIQTCDPSRFDYSALVILFITSYFIVSKWWPITEWNKSYLFSARKFRQQLNKWDEVVTFRS